MAMPILRSATATHLSGVERHEQLFDAGLSALYAQNGDVARAIMEWRHKVVMLYVASLGAVGSAWLWLYDHHVQRMFPPVTYAAAIVMVVLGAMDDTNAKILKSCYRVGAEIERIVCPAAGGVFAAMLIRSQSRRTFTYSRILRVTFFGTAAVLLSIGTSLRL